ncbi:MAG: hypothetical protein IJS61_09915 [Firmicutes bacterium]|nr:hypothetical protein [Bacillota bacterium]
MKFFKRLLSAAMAASMFFTCMTGLELTVSAAPSLSDGWNETLYAEWADEDPDSENVKVGYRLSGESEYTYLQGEDLKYLVRPATTSGYGRVDIPGIRSGRYDIEITASDGTVHTRNGIKVYAYDRSGYAHWKYSTGVGAYNNDGTLKDNALVVYVTDENKDTVTYPGYENITVSYSSSSSGASWTRGCEGVGDLLNNNHKLVRKVTGPTSEKISGINGEEVNCDNHPVVFRFIGTVKPPKNLTPYDAKTNELGGSEGDNGNLAITKYGKNITIEGIGPDATIDGWGFTFSQTSTCPADAGESFEVRNLTFKNYAEDGLGFQGDNGRETAKAIRRVWVHNNVFYPGYCANPTESDKSEGDGSCDFKRGQYYTMSYNHYVKCHKTNLLGKGSGDEQFYCTLHHNWYEDVASRQPLGADGNTHIYNTYFQDTGSAKKHNTSQVVDLRGAASYFLENNYFENCKNYYKTRNNTSYAKLYNNITTDDTYPDSSQNGKVILATSRTDSGLTNGLTFLDGSTMDDWDQNASQFYYSGGKTNVEVLNETADVPEYVKTYGGTLKQFPMTESGEIRITVTTNGTPITDAEVSANGLSFKNIGNGVYTATAQLGSEYKITAAKEGYSSASVTSTVLENDGDVFSKTLDLPVDYDGYAAVNITGGVNEAAVTGATVTLNNGDVLKEVGNGLYKSENQYAVGKYSVTVSNAGDYIAPTTAFEINVKTTDAATDIHLDKKQGNVSVSVVRASGQTEVLDTSKAVIYVGDTQLTNAGNNTFTGSVEINTPFLITASIPGWNADEITPYKLTATENGTATAKIVVSAKGRLFIWNYTDGTNTEDFFTVTNASEWGSAKNNPVEFDGQTLTKAVKVDSKISISFEAPTAGTLTLIMDAKAGSTLSVTGVGTVDCATTTSNVITIPIEEAGEVIIQKGKTESHLYYMQFEGQSNTEPDTGLSDEYMWDVTVPHTDAEYGLEFGEKFNSNSEESKTSQDFTEGETTYVLPATWIQGSTNPVNAAGINPQGALSTDKIPASGAFIKFTPEKSGVFTAAVKTGAGKITYVTDGSGNILNQIGSADSTDNSFDVIRTEVKKNKSYYLYSGGSKVCIYYLGFTAGEESDDEVVLGDANSDGTVDAKDASVILQFAVSGNTADASFLAAADVNKDGTVDAKDASLVLQFSTGIIKSFE